MLGATYRQADPPQVNDRGFVDSKLLTDHIHRELKKIERAINSGVMLDGTAPPAAANSAGRPGEIRFSPGTLYICTAQDSWEQVALSAIPSP